LKIMNQVVSVVMFVLWLHCGGGAKMGITGTLGTKDWSRNRRDYLRETEDMLSYEPFLGVANPPSEHTAPGHLGQQHQPGPSNYSPGGVQHSNEGGMSASDPMFAGPIKNVTVNVGREAVLECLVNNLRQYKVGWLKAGDQTILALHKRVITHNARVSVSHEDNRIWKLHLRSVVESDRGCYMCQINTEKMKQQNGCLDVNVPPDIDYLKTSQDVVAQEGENVTLVCSASGHPTPRITWRREDRENIVRKPGRDKNGTEKYEGENLTISKVGRAQMGAYLCIASNDVPPTVSKRITLNVNFAPEILVPNQLLGYSFGASVVAECLVEAFPNTINYWMKHQTEMLLNSEKYTVIEERTSDYKQRMLLKIENFQESDVGVYTCISTNSLGKSDGTIRFYEIPPAERITAGPRVNKVTTTTEQIEIKFIENKGMVQNEIRNDKALFEDEDEHERKKESSRGSSSHKTNNRRTFQSGFNSGAERCLPTLVALTLSILHCN